MMHKQSLFAARRLLLLLAALLAAGGLSAQRSTTYTYTPNPKGAGYYTRTGDAYLPGLTLTELGLSRPQDLYVSPDNILYIADTGNRRILVYDIDAGRASAEIRHPDFANPTGVWVSNSGKLYVADPDAKTVFVFGPDRALVQRYLRPSQAAYGDRDFAPKKVAVDSAGNLFIISEGIYDGVLQISPQGQFLGYFTSNQISLSFAERLQDLFFTEEQKANLLARNPVTFSNLFVNQQNILFTSTIGKDEEAIKKHNAAGAAIVTGASGPETHLVDLWVSPEEIIVAVAASGETILYTREGDVIALFGESYQGGDVAGLFDTPSAVAMDKDGRLWFLDEQSAYLQSYEPTPYIQRIYRALELFDNGEYARSIEVWQQVLEVNQISRIAHISLGKNYLFLRDFDRALYHSRIANDKATFSDSFWETRNIWLQRNVMLLVFGVILFLALPPMVRYATRRGIGPLARLAPAASARPRFGQRGFGDHPRAPGLRGILEDIAFQAAVLRNPADAFYYIRTGRIGSVPTAAALYAGFFVIFLVFIAGKGFVYQDLFVEDIDFPSVVLGFFGVIGLFLLSNYLGTSVNDGRGDIKDLFIMLAYTFVPVWIAMITSTALSYVLTLNEVFALELIMGVGWVWWAVLLIVGLKEIHEYSTGGVLVSILFSVMFMLVLIIVAVVIWVMAQQVFQFFLAIGKEIVRNVQL